MKQLVVFLTLSTLVCGCGPIVSGVQIVNANVALNAAKTAGAKVSAVYEYTAAKEYLQKAREEHGYSDFWAARIYADKALDYAVRARKRALDSSGDGPAFLPESPPPSLILEEPTAPPMAPEEPAAPVIVPTE